MKVSDDLDRRFRERASARAPLDVAYDFVDSPIGALLVAVTDRGLCRIGFDAEPERDLDPLARLFGAEVLRAPKALDETRRELDEYFEGAARRSSCRRRPLRRVPAARDGRARRVPYGEVTTYGALAARPGTRAPRARSGRS